MEKGSPEKYLKISGRYARRRKNGGLRRADLFVYCSRSAAWVQARVFYVEREENLTKNKRRFMRRKMP